MTKQLDLSFLFRFEAAECDMEDDQYVLLANEDFTVQVCRGSVYGGRTTYSVNRWSEAEGGMYHLGDNLSKANAFSLCHKAAAELEEAA